MYALQSITYSHSNGTFSLISKLVNSLASFSVNVPKPWPNLAGAIFIFVNSLQCTFNPRIIAIRNHTCLRYSLPSKFHGATTDLYSAHKKAATIATQKAI